MALGTATLSFAGQVLLGQIVATTAWVQGSLVSSNIFLLPDTSTTLNPGIFEGKIPAFQPYDGQASTVFTSSGGRVNYTIASALNPTTATQALLSFAVDIKRAPVGSNDITCGVGPSGFTNSGSTVQGQSSTFLMKHKATSSGYTLIASGSSMQNIIPPNWGIRCWTLIAPGAGVQGQIRAVARGQYVP